MADGNGRTRRWGSALVTGASSGIGDALARCLAAEGTDLVVVARDAARLERLAGELTAAHGVSVEVLPADLGAPVARHDVERRLDDPGRPIDLLVNNAGFGTNGTFHEMSVDREEQEVQVNALALLRLTHAALGPMVARGSGHVLNVASIGGLYPIPGSATYGATKAFVCSFGDAVHEELRGTGVHLTTSLPGFTRTEFQERSAWEGQEGLPGFAWLTAEEVARGSLDGAWAGKARVVPARRYQVLTAATAPVPPFLKRRIMGRAQDVAW
ncbi:MAG: SDR family NAD(P)-dependent oxidoreductase [Microthrixaceae bacterium]